MRVKTTTAAVLALAATAVSAAPAVAAPTQYEGTVTSIDRDARTFRLRDSQRGAIRIRVTRNTRWERIAGFSALRVNMKRVEATVTRRNDRWIALEVERSGGGGRHGGGGDDD
jgi:hypothetical protein